MSLFNYIFNYFCTENNKTMKKYYYITLFATIIILILQVNYVKLLHNEYTFQQLIEIKKYILLAIDQELNYRIGNYSDKLKNKVYVIDAEEMSPIARDSLKQLKASQDVIIVDSIQKIYPHLTTGEIMNQASQDKEIRKGRLPNLHTIDSIYTANFPQTPDYCLTLYNKKKQPIESRGILKQGEGKHTSRLFPIGLKKQYYVQIAFNLPTFGFVNTQLRMLLLSTAIIIAVMICLFIQLVTIRRKDLLLRKREESINGTIHDMKSPLNSVVTLLSWIEKNEPDGTRRKMMEDCREGVRHLVGNIESLLVTARHDRKKLILCKKETDMAALAERIRKEMDALFMGKPHTLTIENKLPQGFTLQADTMYMENVLRNLVENALKYADEGVHVQVRLSAGEGKMKMEVKDNGWGIPRKSLKRIFRQFYQVPRSNDRIRKGYGIGLAQALYIVQAHKGDIKVKSREGEGSLFTVMLPIA